MTLFQREKGRNKERERRRRMSSLPDEVAVATYELQSAFIGEGKERRSKREKSIISEQEEWGE